MMIIAIILGHFVIKDCWGLPYTFWDGGKLTGSAPITQHTSRSTHHISRSTHHTSRSTHHTSHITVESKSEHQQVSYAPHRLYLLRLRHWATLRLERPFMCVLLQYDLISFDSLVKFCLILLHSTGKRLFPTRVMSYLLFYTNYCDQITHGSFLGSLMWSCSVDLQVGLFMLIVIKVCSSLYKPTDTLSFIRLLRVVFVILFVVACLIRGSIFDQDKVNMVQLGQYFHFRMLQPRSSYTWMEEFFGHEWQTSTSAIDKTHEYLNKMYFPSHTRFGPFMVGGVVACCLLLSQDKYKNKNKKKEKGGALTLGTVLAWLCTMMAVVQLAVPCLPAPPIGKPSSHTAAAATTAIDMTVTVTVTVTVTAPADMNNEFHLFAAIHICFDPLEW